MPEVGKNISLLGVGWGRTFSSTPGLGVRLESAHRCEAGFPVECRLFIMGNTPYLLRFTPTHPGSPRTGHCLLFDPSFGVTDGAEEIGADFADLFTALFIRVAEALRRLGRARRA
jgi:hypothetical protein